MLRAAVRASARMGDLFCSMPAAVGNSGAAYDWELQNVLDESLIVCLPVDKRVYYQDSAPWMISSNLIT